MKTRQLTGIACLLALAGSAASALQEPTPLGTSPAPSRSSTPDRSGTATSSQMQSGQAIRASQMIGSTVKSSDGKIVGQVRDIVADAQSGRIDFAILSLSGGNDTSATPSSATTPTTSTTTPSSSTSYSASAGAKFVPVPWQLFSQNFSGTSAFGSSSSTLGAGTLGGTMTLTLNIDEAKLRNAPSFDANNWSTLQGSDFAQRSYAYYGLDWNNRMSATGTAGSGVSSGIGTSSSDRSSSAPGAQTKPRTDTNPERRGPDAAAPPQAK